MFLHMGNGQWSMDEEPPASSPLLLLLTISLIAEMELCQQAMEECLWQASAWKRLRNLFCGDVWMRGLSVLYFSARGQLSRNLSGFREEVSSSWRYAVVRSGSWVQPIGIPEHSSPQASFTEHSNKWEQQGSWPCSQHQPETSRTSRQCQWSTKHCCSGIAPLTQLHVVLWAQFQHAFISLSQPYIRTTKRDFLGLNLKTLKMCLYEYILLVLQVRRERISERLKYLQALIPNGDKVCSFSQCTSFICSPSNNSDAFNCNNQLKKFIVWFENQQETFTRSWHWYITEKFPCSKSPLRRMFQHQACSFLSKIECNPSCKWSICHHH